MSDQAGDEERHTALRRHLETLPWAPGVLAGIATFVAGYVVFFLLLVATGAVNFSRSVVEILRSVGYLFYNAHNIPTLERQRQIVEEDGEVAAELVRETWRNHITGWGKVREQLISGGEVVEEGTVAQPVPADPTLPPEVYLTVPIAVLIVASAIFTRRFVRGERVDSPVDATVVALGVAGAITLGYVLVVLVGTYLLSLQGDMESTFLRPARLEALGYGLAYPFVCSCVGAGIVLGLESDES